MERLTYRNSFEGEAYLFRGADAKWQKIDGYDVLKNGVQRLAEYEEAEEKGTVQRLKCAIGDMVFYISEKLKHPIAFEIVEIDIFRNQIVYIDDSENEWGESEFGEVVFVSLDEAEVALASHNQAHAEEVFDERNGR